MWCNVNIRGQSKTIVKTFCGLRSLIIWVFIVLDMKLSSLWNATKSKWKPGRETFVGGEVHFLMRQAGRTGREGGSSLMADSRNIKFSDFSMNRIVIIIFIFIFKEGGRSLLADSCQITTTPNSEIQFLAAGFFLVMFRVVLIVSTSLYPYSSII